MSTLVMMKLLMLALALVMSGLGLSLTPADFGKLWQDRRAVATAIALQMLLLPLVALAIAHALQLSPAFAVGLVLLAATPGSISANLFSHVFGGNVALNISLTGLNTLLCAFTLPLACGWAMLHFGSAGDAVPPLFGKVVEVVSVVIVPVLVGMAVRHFAPALAGRMERPMRIVSAAVLAFFVVAAIAKEWTALTLGFAQVGGAVVAFNLLSLAIPFCAARALQFDRATTVSISFQVAIHNAVLAIYVAMTVLEDPQIALPAAVYSVTMNLLAATFGLWVRRRGSVRIGFAATAAG
jgi:BASS family bile acid:Na+ symporter